MKKIFKTRQIGKTKLQVSELGFGAASLGNLYKAVSEETANETLQAVINSGINLVDTAPFYGFGLSERRIGEGLREQGEFDYVLSTKVGRILKADPTINIRTQRNGFFSPMPFSVEYDYSYDGIMRSFEDSRQRLGLAKIDILLVHDIGEETHGDLDGHYFSQLKNSGYSALEELRRNNDISAFGLGVNESEVCERAMDFGQFDCFLLAGRYTLLEQDALKTLLPKCEESETSIIIGGPYNSGILATGVNHNQTINYNYMPAPKEIVERVSQIETICQQHEISLAAAALQFPLAHPVVSSVIPGIATAERVEKTIGLFQESIAPEFWHQLKTAGLLNENVPVPA